MSTTFLQTLRKHPLLKWILALWGLGLAVLVMGLMLWPRSPTLLAQGNHLAESRLIEQWQAGELVVLVRHAERCDQSNNPCLGPPDGITRVGELASANVGKALSLLGLERTDVLTSPTTRTVQTAHSMFSREVTQQEWLAACGTTLRDEVVAHKSARRNLVLVTHSGCISEFEAQNGFRRAMKAAYTSALFVTIKPDGQLEVLGILNTEDWPIVLNKQIAKN
ncbi:histidine phosphatase family protein [Pseudomonas sp. MYb115]|nr:histidine phosphatase family protein [Pseudomonas sp. MYb115]QXN52965.1 histidine phosphatase family protein [Pseudomonas fluorescens]